MLKAIVGMEIRIERLDGKFKLSQNREMRDIVSVGQTLIERGEVGLGQSMPDCAACYRPTA